MSSPSEPDEMVSTSIERSFLPSFITEPLPNWRSIWESAADRALVLSMEDPSTIRRAVADIGRAPYGGGLLAGQTGGGRGLGNGFLWENFFKFFYFGSGLIWLSTRPEVAIARSCPIGIIPSGSWPRNQPSPG